MTQPTTGVQRYAAEMIRALDGVIGADEVPDELKSAEWILLKPAGGTDNLSLRRIVTRTVRPWIHPRFWDQAVLSVVARDGILLSLANSGPIAHRRHLAVIHDAIVFRHPEFYERGYALFHRTLGRLLAKTATIGTVSDFSRRELTDVLGNKGISIPILPNGADHLFRIKPDETVLDDLDLRGRPFFLALGSVNGNKNVGLAVRAFSTLNRPDARLIVVGAEQSIFRTINLDVVPGVIQAGRLSDERISALYAHTAAFIFPSIYEGFGIPPLEAMSFGSPVLASTAEALRETCGAAASYFASDDVETLATLLAGRLTEGPYSDERRSNQMRRAAQFTWEGSARRLLKIIPTL